MLSLPDAIGQALESYMSEKHGVQETLPLTANVATDGSQALPASGLDQETAFFREFALIVVQGQLSYEEGCVKCHICGYSECG